MNARLERFRDALVSRSASSYVEYGLDGLGMSNLRYLCGLRRGRGALVFVGDSVHLVLHPVEAEYARTTVAPTCRLVPSEDPLSDIVRLLDENGASHVHVDPTAMTIQSFRDLRARMPHREIRTLSSPARILRQCKDPAEVLAVSQAARLSTSGFYYILGELRIGITERELAISLNSFLHSQGATDLAFRTMVSFGEHCALPHSIPGDRELLKGDLVLFDFGASVDGYCSDMTRTVAYGEISERWRSIYEHVAEAQKAALSAVRPGVTAAAVDAAARVHLEDAGYGSAFVHGVGHGVGLQVSELPYLDASSAELLEEGMVLTVEPGVYIPGEGGVRIEDLVVVTSNGCRILSDATKELIVVS